jgi:hypothetical protein
VSSLQDRLARVEALLSASNAALSDTQCSTESATSHTTQLMPPLSPLSEILDSDFAAATALASLQTLPGTPVSSRIPLPPSLSASSRSAIPTYPLANPTQPGRSEEDDDDGSSVVPPEEEVSSCLVEVRWQLMNCSLPLNTTVRLRVHNAKLCFISDHIFQARVHSSPFVQSPESNGYKGKLETKASQDLLRRSLTISPND